MHISRAWTDKTMGVSEPSFEQETVDYIRRRFPTLLVRTLKPDV